jgi:hypothetical protein
VVSSSPCPHLPPPSVCLSVSLCVCVWGPDLLVPQKVQ